METKLHEFLTSVLDGNEWSTSQFIPGEKKPKSPLGKRLGGIQSWFGSSSKDKNPCPCWKLNFSHPVSSQSFK
jgi:hypothetical protein